MSVVFTVVIHSDKIFATIDIKEKRPPYTIDGTLGTSRSLSVGVKYTMTAFLSLSKSNEPKIGFAIKTLVG